MAAPAARVSEHAQHWVKAGHNVTVLTGFPNHPDGVLAPEYRRHFRRVIFRETMQSVNVVRSWLLPIATRKSYQRMLSFGSFFLSLLVTGSFLEKPDIVIATSPQLLVGLAGWWISRLKRVPFVLEIRDLWPESLVAVGIGTANSFLYRLLAKLAAFLYRAADRIVVVTPAFREHLVRKYPVLREKISVIPNGVEAKIFAPRNPDPSLREALGGTGAFIVSFIGTVGLAHGLDTLIGAAEKSQSSNPEVLFLLVGEGADRERIIEIARTKKLTNVRFLPQQPRARIPDFIAISDVCLVLLKKSQVFKTVIPTKMLEFMSCSRPVILGVEGQAQEILEQSHAGICIEPENFAALSEAIVKLRNDEQLRQTMGRNGREYILASLSRSRLAAEYLEVLAEVIDGPTFRRAAAA